MLAPGPSVDPGRVPHKSVQAGEPEAMPKFLGVTTASSWQTELAEGQKERLNLGLGDRHHRRARVSTRRLTRGNRASRRDRRGGQRLSLVQGCQPARTHGGIPLRVRHEHRELRQRVHPH